MTRLPLILGATLAALAFSPLVAEAGHFGGGGHGGGGGHFSGGAHFSGGGFHGGIHVGGSIHVGGGYVARGGHFGHSRYGGYGGYGGYRGGHVWVGGGGNPYWYRPYWYWPGYVPSYYYGNSYYPVETSTYAGPQTVVVAAPELPRFGIGIFGGLTSTDYNTQNNISETDYGLLARFRLTHGLIVEGELGKDSTSVNGQADIRVDRRLGGSLLYEFGAQNHLAPYVLAGLGVEQANTDGSYNTTMDYGEVGAGLRYAFTPHFHVTFDLRVGSRSTISDDDAGTTARSTGVAPPASDSGDHEDYTRGRLAAILYF